MKNNINGLSVYLSCDNISVIGKVSNIKRIFALIKVNNLRIGKRFSKRPRDQ